MLDDEDGSQQQDTSRLPPVRYTIVGLLCLGAFTYNMSRVTLNTAIITMAPQEPPSDIVSSILHNQTSFTISDAVNASGFGLLPKGKQYEFDWSEEKQSTLLGAFYIGNVFALVPSGRLTESYGGKSVALVGGTFNVVLNLLSPMAARHNYWAIFSIRVVLGASGASLLPAFYGLITRWVPDNEKSKTIAFLSVGGSLGTIILTLLSGYLCQYGVDGGWPSVFYFTGLLCFIWLILWIFAVTTHPMDHPFISNQEIKFIVNNTSYRLPRHEYPPPKPPWSRMIFSKPVLATIFVKITHSWFYNLFALKLTNYITNIYKMNVEQVSIFNTLFHSVILASVLVSGVLSDMAISRGVCSKTVVRKSFESFATFGSSLFVAMLPFTGNSQIGFVLVMCLALVNFGMSTGGSATVIMDMTSDYAATLVAIMSTISMFVGFLTPPLISLILVKSASFSGSSSIWQFWLPNTAEHTTTASPSDRIQRSWNIVFYLTSLFQVIGGVVFLLFGSAEHQHWENNHSSENNEQHKSIELQRDRMESGELGEVTCCACFGHNKCSRDSWNQTQENRHRSNHKNQDNRGAWVEEEQVNSIFNDYFIHNPLIGNEFDHCDHRNDCSNDNNANNGIEHEQQQQHQSDEVVYAQANNQNSFSPQWTGTTYTSSSYRPS